MFWPCWRTSAPRDATPLAGPLAGIHFAVQKPRALAIAGVLWRPIVVQIENLSAVGAHAEVVATDAPGTTAGSSRGAFGTHVARHAASTAVVMPFAQFFNDTMGLLPPDEPIGTARLLAQRRRLIELGLNLLTDG